MYGNARRQLMHEYVQKSTTITLPLSAAFVSGFVLSHVVAPASSGMSPSIFGAPSAVLLDIIAPEDMASFAAGFALIIIAPPFIERPASTAAAGAIAARRPASATSTGVDTYSAGSTFAKFRTFGMSLN